MKECTEKGTKRKRAATNKREKRTSRLTSMRDGSNANNLKLLIQSGKERYFFPFEYEVQLLFEPGTA